MKNRWFSTIAVKCVLLIMISAAAQAQKKAEIHDITWNLSDLYTDETAWQTAVRTLEINIAGISRFQNHLSDGAATLQQALDHVSETNKQAARLYVYAALKSDEDLNNTDAQKNLAAALALFNALAEATKFIAPEITAIGEHTVKSFIEQEPGLARHAFRLYDILRRAKHTAEGENLSIVKTSEAALDQARDAYRDLTEKSVLWPFLMLENGQGLSLSPAVYTRYRGVTNRKDRKAILDAFWAAWQPHLDRFAHILHQVTVAQNRIALAQHYASAVDQAASEDGMSSALYRKLVSAANQHLPTFHRYLNLRARLLGVKDQQYYDLHADIAYLNRRFSIADAKAITADALSLYGKDYIEQLQRGFRGQWMHPYPRPGKRSGAYTQSAAYDVHPYLLLNFNDRYSDVSTFAHEWGHAVHALLSAANNPFETYTYSPFVGEMASLVNEILLQDYMLASDIDDDASLFYITKALEMLHANFFRQGMFAEFELRIHEQASSGKTLTGADYSALYLDLLRKYHGHDQDVMHIDEKFAAEWAYIPHFTSNFYVYRHTASMAGAAFFANRLLAGNTGTKDAFINLLKAGGSGYPHNLLMAAGLDLTSGVPYDAVITRMNRLMDTAEVILKRTGR